MTTRRTLPGGEEPTPIPPVDDLLDMVQRARAANDIEAFSSAFDQLESIYAPYFYGFARRRGLPHPDAQDIVQETFLRVVRGIGTYRRNGRASGWLWRICRRTIIDHFRTGDRQPHIVDVPDISEINLADLDPAQWWEHESQARAWDCAEAAVTGEDLHELFVQGPGPGRGRASYWAAQKRFVAAYHACVEMLSDP